MTIAQLIDALRRYNPDASVTVSVNGNDSGIEEIHGLDSSHVIVFGVDTLAAPTLDDSRFQLSVELDAESIPDNGPKSKR